MAIIQSDWAKGLKTPARPQTAGAVHTTKFSITVDQNVGTSDIIELGVLPAYAHIVDAVLFTEGTFTGVTASVGIMSGEVGSTDASRTSGTELFNGADLTNVNRMELASGWLLAPAADKHRSIGLQVSAAVTAATSKKIHLVLSYIQ